MYVVLFFNGCLFFLGGTKSFMSLKIALMKYLSANVLGFEI